MSGRMGWRRKVTSQNPHTRDRRAGHPKSSKCLFLSHPPTHCQPNELEPNGAKFRKFTCNVHLLSGAAWNSCYWAVSNLIVRNWASIVLSCGVFAVNRTRPKL
jgi:hypothetical protein